jgi:2-polyprenyl-3-methyl-5-hydroxy-6-metoxy-1,4-benzoquinol methylase
MPPGISERNNHVGSSDTRPIIRRLYSTDLAFVHDAGFGDLAARATPAVVRVLRRHGIRGGTIVELGCGSGITARYLVARGYDVVGIDASAAMIRLARQKAPAATFRPASIATTRIPPCRAVIALGEVITYLPGGLSAVGGLFRRVHAALEPGGLLIFDFIESAARRTHAVKSRGGPGWAIVSVATLDRARRVLTRRIVVVRRIGQLVRGSRETHRVRIYRRAEIRAALARAGFSVRTSRSYGRYRLLPGDVVVVARRV